MRHRLIAVLLTVALAACGLAVVLCACGGPAGEAVVAAEASEAAAQANAGKTIDIRHLEPSPDFVGAQPARFAWSKVDNADTYTLRIWNEADVRVLSQTGLTTTAVDFPKENDLPAGTYFWSIVGMRGDQAIAESGLAAFVVQTP